MTRSYSNLLFWLVITIAASLMLYHTSDRVNELEQQLRTLNAQIDAERESLHVLNAEWVYLANPVRIQEETERHLSLQPTVPYHVVSLENIASLLPVHDGLEPVFVASEPFQNKPAVSLTKSGLLSTASSSGKHDVVALSSANTSLHINDHMVMQHATTEKGDLTKTVKIDRIGALINTLGMYP